MIADIELWKVAVGVAFGLFAALIFIPALYWTSSDERYRRIMGWDRNRSPDTPGCNHEWVYKDRESGETYTGYCEWCPKCGAIRQIPQ